MLNRKGVHALSAVARGGLCGFLAVLMLLGGMEHLAAQEKDPRPAAGLQDNSFLIEEAYNQEAGVVQHIMGLRRQNGAWSFRLHR